MTHGMDLALRGAFRAAYAASPLDGEATSRLNAFLDDLCGGRVSGRREALERFGVAVGDAGARVGRVFLKHEIGAAGSR